MVGLISGGDETAYREEVQRLSTWCTLNNLVLNTSKTKELIVDYRRKKSDMQPIAIHVERVERVSDFSFLGTHIEEDLSWARNTTALLKKAQQRLYFLRLLKKNKLKKKLLVSFYRCSVESVLNYGISLWFASCTAAERKVLQRVLQRVNTVQKVTGCSLPPLEDIYKTRCLRTAHSILRDSTHPGYHLFELLPSGRRFRTIKAKTDRLRNSFYPRAIIALNNAQN